MQAKTKEEIKAMSRSEISHYISEITQTPICMDKEYCNFLVKELMAK
jgi:hypothetical protein